MTERWTSAIGMHAVDQLDVAADIKVSMGESVTSELWQLGRAAKRCYSEALPVFEAAHPNSRQVAVLRWNLSQVLRRAGEEPARQVELLRGSLAIRTLLGDEDDIKQETAMLSELLEEQTAT